jgi:hypothetical protein
MIETVSASDIEPHMYRRTNYTELPNADSLIEVAALSPLKDTQTKLGGVK